MPQSQPVKDRSEDRSTAEPSQRKTPGQTVRPHDDRRRLVFHPHEEKALIEAGFSRQLLSNWRLGIFLPSKEHAPLVAKVTGRPLIECLYGRIDILNETPEEEQPASESEREEVPPANLLDSGNAEG